MTDFYDGVTERTDYTVKKMQTYVDLAIKQGDSVYQVKPGVLEITIIKPKEKKDVTIKPATD